MRNIGSIRTGIACSWSEVSPRTARRRTPYLVIGAPFSIVRAVGASQVSPAVYGGERGNVFWDQSRLKPALRVENLSGATMHSSQKELLMVGSNEEW